MANNILWIICPRYPKEPWIVFNKDQIQHYDELTIKTPCKTVTRDIPDFGTVQVLETIATLYKHPLRDKATIQSNSLPRPY